MSKNENQEIVPTVARERTDVLTYRGHPAAATLTEAPFGLRSFGVSL